MRKKSTLKQPDPNSNRSKKRCVNNRFGADHPNLNKRHHRRAKNRLEISLGAYKTMSSLPGASHVNYTKPGGVCHW
jgi:hypothetical protein